LSSKAVLFNSDNNSDTNGQLFSDSPGVSESIGESDPLSLYLKQISRYPLLSAEEERVLAEGIAKTRESLESLLKKSRPASLLVKESKKQKHALDIKLGNLKNKMINSNLRLVVAIAKKYQYRGLSLLDLIDEGNIGLIEAVGRFDYKRGCRFTTYGTWWIRQAIIKSLADQGRIIRIPIHMLNTIKKCYYVARYLTQELGHDPTNDELAEFMHIKPAKVEDIMKLSKDTISLDSPVDDEQVTRLSEMISDESTREPFEVAFTVALQDTLERVLSRLNKREVRIIKLRFGLTGEGPCTLEETGRVLGITRERVRQIQEKAISKLRHVKQVKELKDFIDLQ
jgi:RNA polymerase primary sigma factor